MADIYAFPASPSEDGRGGVPRPEGVPDVVWHAVQTVRAMPHMAGMRYREIPVPSTLADFGIGVDLEYDSSDEPPSRTATGWIMVLYAAQGRRGWTSQWRCVAFARLPLDENERDCLTPSMYWEDMLDALDAVDPEGVRGTVTVTRNTSFGDMESEPHAGCEMRVSWTPSVSPEGADAGAQVSVWAQFLRASVNDGERTVIG